MYAYDFDLVGMRITLQSPEPVLISKNLQPFLCSEGPNADCTIWVRGCATLPSMEGQGYWSGPDCYHYEAGSLCIYHGEKRHGKPFAVTRFAKEELVEILALPDYLSSFSDTSGIFNRIGMENLLLQHKGLLLHASLIEFAGKAVAFAGPSGVGKSTQAELWKTYQNANILNGDRAALRKKDGKWHAYGSPYAGSSGLYCQANAPLAGIVILEQHTENSLQTLTPTQALMHLYPELSVHRWDSVFVQQATDLCLQLLQDIPVLLLKCRPDAAAVELVKKGLSL